MNNAGKQQGLSLNMLLLSLIGFFATWGEGMQHVISKASFIYPALIAIYMLLNYNCFIKSVKYRNIVPKEFKILYIYVIIHTIIYVIINYQNIGFGSESGEINDEGFAFGKTENGITIIRYFVFLLFSLYLSVEIRKVISINIFCISYVVGFIITILGGAFHEYGNGMIRISGGLQDPNVMAFDALIAFIFSLFILKKYHSKGIRILLFVSVIIELLAVFLSFSRGALLALFAWGVIYMIHKGIFHNIMRVVIALILFLYIGYIAIDTFNINKDEYDTRFSIEEIIATKGANRGLIWKVYLSNMDKYCVTGTGIGNSTKVMKGNRFGLAENYESHNLYIQFFAEFGIIGLLLYMIYWQRYIRELRRTPNELYLLMSLGFILLIVTLFLNLDKGRTFWIVLAIINMIWIKNKEIYSSKENEKNLGVRFVK